MDYSSVQYFSVVVQHHDMTMSQHHNMAVSQYDNRQQAHVCRRLPISETIAGCLLSAVRGARLASQASQAICLCGECVVGIHWHTVCLSRESTREGSAEWSLLAIKVQGTCRRGVGGDEPTA